MIESRVGAQRDEYLIAAIGDRDGKRADARVTVGGGERDFKPIMQSSKWSDRAWLSLDARRTAKVTPTIKDGVVEWIDNNEKFRFYEQDGEFEFEVVFAVQPASNVVEFDIDFPVGLRFLKQRALTPAEVARGNIQPARVLGSYALYWNQRDNEYKTGKYGHIYRPEVIDSLGARAWCELDVDPSLKKLYVTMPAAWMAAAVYPVTLDPTIGNTSSGASTDATDSFQVANLYQAGFTGTLATFFVRAFAATGTCPMGGGIFDSDGAADTLPDGHALIGTHGHIPAVDTTEAWWSASMSAAVTSGTYYWLTIGSSNNGRLKYDAGATPDARFNGVTYVTSLQTPWPVSSFGSDFLMSMYAETAAAGVVPVLGRRLFVLP